MSLICHFTSVHKAYDTRIMLKECRSLARAGHQVFLVAEHERSETTHGVQIIGLKKRHAGRLNRIFFFTWKVFFAALKTKSEVYHFHDPELIPFGVLLRLLGKKVIFDIHENIAGQMKVKGYLPFNNQISRLYRLVDRLSAKLFFLILAEHSYRKIYEHYTADLEVVLNMPDLDFLQNYKHTDRSVLDTIELFYVGGISFERGIETVVNAVAELKARGYGVNFHCVGPNEPSVMDRIKALPRFSEAADSLRFYGRERLDVALERSKNCHVGLSVLLPIENYLESYSTKIFEYMAIGLPVITSDFQLYRDVVERHRCGFCIDPLDSIELADRITELALDKNMICEMSRNGIKAAETEFNWAEEEKKLLGVYNSFINK